MISASRRGMVLGEEVAQDGGFAVADQLAEVGHQERMSHGPSSSSTTWTR